jgi:hypothetical protein
MKKNAITCNTADCPFPDLLFQHLEPPGRRAIQHPIPNRDILSQVRILTKHVLPGRTGERRIDYGKQIRILK